MRDDLEMQGGQERRVDRKAWHRPELVDSAVQEATANGAGSNTDGIITTSGAPG